MNNNTVISMVKCENFNAAIEMYDRNNESGFYDSYENERLDHIRFYNKYPAMATQWMYCETDGYVYKVSQFNDQKMINKHTLSSSLSCGNLSCVIATESENEFIFVKTPNKISKYDKELRDGWCRLNENHFLTGDL